MTAMKVIVRVKMLPPVPSVPTEAWKILETLRRTQLDIMSLGMMPMRRPQPGERTAKGALDMLRNNLFLR